MTGKLDQRLPENLFARQPERFTSSEFFRAFPGQGSANARLIICSFLK